MFVMRSQDTGFEKPPRGEGEKKLPESTLHDNALKMKTLFISNLSQTAALRLQGSPTTGTALNPSHKAPDLPRSSYSQRPKRPNDLDKIDPEHASTVIFSKKRSLPRHLASNKKYRALPVNSATRHGQTFALEGAPLGGNGYRRAMGIVLWREREERAGLSAAPRARFANAGASKNGSMHRSNRRLRGCGDFFSLHDWDSPPRLRCRALYPRSGSRCACPLFSREGPVLPRRGPRAPKDREDWDERASKC